jgi:hypothetical protein
MGIGEIPAADLARYRELIDCCGIHGDERDQVILIVVNIMKSFVDIAFQNTLSTESSRARIESNQTLQQDFALAVRPKVESSNAKDVQHDQKAPDKGCHLLPR